MGDVIQITRSTRSDRDTSRVHRAMWHFNTITESLSDFAAAHRYKMRHVAELTDGWYFTIGGVLFHILPRSDFDLATSNFYLLTRSQVYIVGIQNDNILELHVCALHDLRMPRLSAARDRARKSGCSIQANEVVDRLANKP